MSGKVIRTLRQSDALGVLDETDLGLLSGVGRVFTYSPGQAILKEDGQDERIFVLQYGSLALHLRMFTGGGRCGGEVSLRLASPGQTFGWAAWVRPDRIATSAYAVEAVSLVTLELWRLENSVLLGRVRRRMLLYLYGLLQEGGICPPKIQGLLGLGQV